ncbi:MAG: WXG100 family type VII secretion target [Clostridium sp.]|nr:WXG100 family type VII secretion target [Clostridium sp.]
MAGQLKMSTQELTNAKTVISTKNEELTDCIQNVYKEITNLVGSTWTGDAATAALNQIDTFYRKTLTAYKNAVDGYVSFIDATVSKYETTESTLASNAKEQIDSSALADFA